MLHQPSVKHMLANMTSRELTEWEIFIGIKNAEQPQ